MQPATRVPWRLPSALALVALIALGQWIGRIPGALALVYLVMGLMAFAAFGIDKRLAQRGLRRISEATLHGLDLAFGIVGGLLGQALFRHKTSKANFVASTLLIFGVHLLFLISLVTGFADLPGLVSR